MLPAASPCSTPCVLRRHARQFRACRSWKETAAAKSPRVKVPRDTNSDGSRSHRSPTPGAMATGPQQRYLDFVASQLAARPRQEMMMTQIGELGGQTRPKGLKLKPLLELQPDRFKVTQDPNNPLSYSVRLLGTAPVSVTIAPAVPGLQRDEAPPASAPLQPAVPYQHPFRWFCTVCQQTYEGKVPTGESARKERFDAEADAGCARALHRCIRRQRSPPTGPCVSRL